MANKTKMDFDIKVENGAPTSTITHIGFDRRSNVVTVRGLNESLYATLDHYDSPVEIEGLITKPESSLPEIAGQVVLEAKCLFKKDHGHVKRETTMSGLIDYLVKDGNLRTDQAVEAKKLFVSERGVA